MPFEVPARISQASPDKARLAGIRKAFTESAGPVRPLPSNAAMMIQFVGVFVALAIFFTAPVGFRGFAGLAAFDRLAEYAVILLLAFVLTGGIVEQMIPGSRRVIRPHVGAILAIVLLSLSASLLFPDFERTHFMDRGIPCLRLGLLCAIPAAALTAIVMRRGFVTDPVSAALAGGSLSGLLGVGVLALHCSIFNAAHIIAWHVGVIAVTSFVGAVAGWCFSRIAP